jgi:hypothetical protein
MPSLSVGARRAARSHPCARAGRRLDVERVERVGRQQLVLEVLGHEPALDVVAAEPERHLRQVVGAEREELGDSAISSATSAARGVSIIVPTR